MYYRALNEYLRDRFGCKVYKLSLCSGCTCPNRDGTLGRDGCSFCSGSGEFSPSAALPIPEQLAQARRLVSGKVRDARYIAYFQSYTNTYASAGVLRPLFEAAIAPENIAVLSIATRPDCLPPDILALLRELAQRKPLWVELGLQTMHEETARRIRRGYPLSCFEDAVGALRALGAEVIVHQILGLPGETPEQMVQTSAYIGRCGAAGVKLHLLHVLRGTQLALDYEAGRLRTLELEEYITLLERCLRVLPPELVVHRLTGDGAKRTLLAPLWSADKKRVLNEIHRRFLQDDLIQGSAISARGVYAP